MRKVVRPLVKSKLSWPVLNFFYRVFHRFKFEKDLIEIEKTQKVHAEKESRLRKQFEDLTVQDGLFRGMKYPAFYSHGSSMFAKLLGTYESELYKEFEELLKTDYSEIIDIGCAEGYYAVGLARKKPRAKIYAYDISESAINACREMAKLNGVEGQFVFNNFCSEETLANFKFHGKGLIICDCEGYELELFTPRAVKGLVNCDLVIELHDLYTEKITPFIENAFRQTHTVKLVNSENTFKKFEKAGLRHRFTDNEIQEFFAERNGIMQWAIITSKQ